MGRRKHAWAAYQCLDPINEEQDVLQRAERLVEGAVIEDFTDTLFVRLGQLTDITDETQSRHVALGIRLAIREILQAQYDWTQ